MANGDFDYEKHMASLNDLDRIVRGEAPGDAAGAARAVEALAWASRESDCEDPQDRAFVDRVREINQAIPGNRHEWEY